MASCRKKTWYCKALKGPHIVKRVVTGALICLREGKRLGTGALQGSRGGNKNSVLQRYSVFVEAKDWVLQVCTVVVEDDSVLQHYNGLV